MGCDPSPTPAYVLPSSFNSRTPCGVRLALSSLLETTTMFQFTHPVWGATLLDLLVEVRQLVSIHAPRVGCDASLEASISSRGYVSIHAPRVGCDLCGRYYALHSRCFNSRTPCGVRLRVTASTDTTTTVSIHAPRVGCDWDSDKYDVKGQVSIHAPRVGCDTRAQCSTSTSKSFNSRTPCGVRLQR